MFRLRRPRSPLQLARRAVAVLLALAALVFALRPAPGSPGAQPATVAVVVAATDLPPGTSLTAGDLALARLPTEFVPSGVTGERQPLLGRVLAGGVRAGEPLTDVRLVGAGLTALLPEGLVAAPVRLADLAVAELVHAGDRVDVLATAPDAVTADVVAAGALVLAAPTAVSDPAADSGTGLLVIAVAAPTAARLAAASTASTLTVSLPRPDAPSPPGRPGSVAGDVGG